MLAACFCGSIKNSINLPDEFEGRMARVVEHKRQYPKILPFYMKEYREIPNQGNSDVKCNNMYYINITQQQKSCNICHINSITLSSYLIADDDINPIEQTNPSDNANPRDDEMKKCPFCKEDFISQQLFDDHVLTVHSIDQEGLKQLKSMMKAQQLVSRNQLTYIAEKEWDFPDAPRATKGTQQ